MVDPLLGHSRPIAAAQYTVDIAAGQTSREDSSRRISARIVEPPPIVILVQDGVDPLDLAGPAAVFDRLRRLRPNAPALVYASPDGGAVRGRNGFVLAETMAMASLAGPFDLVLLVGSAENGLHPPAPGGIRGWLAKHAPQARRIGAICGATFLLAAAGLLEGRRVTTHWSVRDRLQAEFPRLLVESDALYCIDGPICTTAGVAAGLDLALALVERDYGPRLATAIARDLVMFMRRSGGQTQVSAVLRAQERSGGRLHAVIEAVACHPQQDWRVGSMAELAGMSLRNFTRHFTREMGRSPAAFVAEIRLERACELLRGTDLPLAAIATSAGFGRLETMAQRFRDGIGMSPGGFRERFGRCTVIPTQRMVSNF